MKLKTAFLLLSLFMVSSIDAQFPGHESIGFFYEIGYHDLYTENPLELPGDEKIKDWSIGVSVKGRFNNHSVRVSGIYSERGGYSDFNSIDGLSFNAQLRNRIGMILIEPLLFRLGNKVIYSDIAVGIYTSVNLVSQLDRGNGWEKFTDVMGYRLTNLDVGPSLQISAGIGMFSVYGIYMIGIRDNDETATIIKNRHSGIGIMVSF